MIGPEFIKAAACLIAWRKQGHNGVNGMLGVLFVIRNRAQMYHAGNWLTAMGDIGDQGFSYYVFPDTRHPEFQKVLERVDGIYDGSIEDKLTNGATFLEPGPGRERVARIGDQDFFR